MKPISRYANDLGIYLAVNLEIRKGASLGRCRVADKFEMDCSRGKEVVKREESRGIRWIRTTNSAISHLISLFKKIH